MHIASKLGLVWYLFFGFIPSMQANTGLPGWGLARDISESLVPTDCTDVLCTIVEVRVRHRGLAIDGSTAKACSKTVSIPHEMYAAINGTLRSLPAGGALPPSLTPAQQTVLLMYATFLQQTTNFDCPL